MHRTAHVPPLPYSTRYPRVPGSLPLRGGDAHGNGGGSWGPLQRPSATGSRSAQHTGWGTRGSFGVRNSAAETKEELQTSQGWASSGHLTHPGLQHTGSLRPIALSCAHGPTPLSVQPQHRDLGPGYLDGQAPLRPKPRERPPGSAARPRKSAFPPQQRHEDLKRHGFNAPKSLFKKERK